MAKKVRHLFEPLSLRAGQPNANIHRKYKSNILQYLRFCPIVSPCVAWCRQPMLHWVSKGAESKSIVSIILPMCKLSADQEAMPHKTNLWFSAVFTFYRVISIVRFDRAVIYTITVDRTCQNRVPTAPGKPGKTGPYLENLEKQGVWGQKPGKILKNLEKNFDLTLKRPKSLNRKIIWKKKI